MLMDVETLIVKLHEIEAVKFGNFTLKSGISSPVYFDLRVIVSAPALLDAVAELLFQLAVERGLSFGQSGDCPNSVSQVCGVPYTALPIATCISTRHLVPMVLRRKEAKSYGTKQLLEGRWSPGDSCLVVEDVVTSGSSVLETARVLRDADLKVMDAVVILDREQGGKATLKENYVRLHSLFTLTEVLTILSRRSLIDEITVEKVQNFIAANQFLPADLETAAKKPKGISTLTMTYERRQDACQPQSLAKKVFALMERKKTNLCVAADVTSTKQLLSLAEQVGPHVCLLKTHVDILDDITPDALKELKDIARKHDFLLFEDRKFADIGNTVVAQYGKGVHRIADWADVTNAHPLPGAGVVEGLETVAKTQPQERGCLLVAEMSSSGNLIDKDYTAAALQMALDHQPFVFGFISQNCLTDCHPELLHMTPGVSLGQKGDGLGQTYDTPKAVVGERGSDIIIVGRGVTKAENPAAEAVKYKLEGWAAYSARTSA